MYNPLDENYWGNKAKIEVEIKTDSLDDSESVFELRKAYYTLQGERLVKLCNLLDSLNITSELQFKELLRDFNKITTLGVLTPLTLSNLEFGIPFNTGIGSYQNSRNNSIIKDMVPDRKTIIFNKNAYTCNIIKTYNCDTKKEISTSINPFNINTNIYILDGKVSIGKIINRCIIKTDRNYVVRKPIVLDVIKVIDNKGCYMLYVDINSSKYKALSSFYDVKLIDSFNEEKPINLNDYEELVKR